MEFVSLLVSKSVILIGHHPDFSRLFDIVLVQCHVTLTGTVVDVDVPVVTLEIWRPLSVVSVLASEVLDPVT